MLDPTSLPTTTITTTRSTAASGSSPPLTDRTKCWTATNYPTSLLHELGVVNSTANAPEEYRCLGSSRLLIAVAMPLPGGANPHSTSNCLNVMPARVIQSI